MAAPIRPGSVTPMGLARLAGLVVLAVLAQTIVFPNARIFGVVPDVGLVMAVAVAYHRGPEWGALFGFVQGVTIDLFLNTPFGLSALAFAITAYVVGLFTEALVRRPRFVAIPLTFVAGTLGGAVFVSIGGIFGQEELFEWASLRVIVLAAVYDAVLAPVVFPIVRRALLAFESVGGKRV